MTNALKTMVLALAGMVLTFYAVGALLSDRWHVETTRSLEGSPQAIAAAVGDFETWQQWSSMKVTLGPQVERRVEGARGTVGHRVVWSGAEGLAMLTLSEVSGDALRYDYHSQRHGDATPTLAGRGQLRWRVEGDQTLVTWRDEGSWDQLAGRWIGWFGGLQERVKQIHSSSLTGLQSYLEQQAAAGAGKVGEEAAKLPAGK